MVIKNDNGTNVIFHTNKTPIRNFRRFYKKAISGGDVHSLHISEQVCLGANNKELSGANALSLTAEKIIPQDPKPIHSSQFKLKKLTKVDKSNAQDKGRNR